jgi:nicotinamide riboside transporter PnuC
VLDDREQHILRDIERQLANGDPSLDRLSRRLHRRIPWWPATTLALGLVVAVFLVTLGVLGHALLLVAVAVVPMARWCWRCRGAGRWGGSPRH